MRAAIFTSARNRSGPYLDIEDVPMPQLELGHTLLRVLACGVCRTDLHIVEGDLASLRPRLIPGHQIVGEVADGATAELPLRTRVGVSWMGGVDGDCWYCQHGMETLCDKPIFTGYTVNGGYAEYVLVRSDFAFPLPAGLDDVHVRLFSAPASLGFAACVLLALSRESALGFLGLEALPAWRLRFCNRGNAKSTLSQGARRIESERPLWAQSGWVRRTISRPCY